ncbi:MAG TPA: FtsX-like permease family protein [Steroidobacteraceae bacterium]|nr:FtsX-like permease family protein [Steroidobacteraceae bacterium]
MPEDRAHAAPRAALAAWRALVVSQLREQPGRFAVTLIAISLGVALGVAVYLVNTAALDEFSLAAGRLVGQADLVLRGPPEGFSESLYEELAHHPEVETASPMLEIEAAIPGRREPLKILGLDPFRAGALQPALIGELSGHLLELLHPDAIVLSAAAAADLGSMPGVTRVPVTVGGTRHDLELVGVLSANAYPAPLGLMDIASAQWTFGRLGRLNRLDLRLRPGTSLGAFRSSLRSLLPAGVLAVPPEIERDRPITLTRAYRVNLNMLALVSLWTGAFLVFSAQSLSVMRRRRGLALLRALGLTRRELERALLGEGALLGVVGSALGVLLGIACAAVLLKLLAGGLGNGQLQASGARLHASAPSLLVFVLLGTLVASLGAWLPARAAARQAPARALKGGDLNLDRRSASRSAWVGLALIIAGALSARLPAVGGLPIFGYAAIAALLCGAIALVPLPTVWLLRSAPRFHRVVLDTALAQLRENVALSTLSLAAVIVSFSLMVAMAIMVYSFRESFTHWLDRLLPADLQLREPLGNDTAYMDDAAQACLARIPGVSRVELRRTRPLLLSASRPPVTLIARNSSAVAVAHDLPLVRRAPAPWPAGERVVFISEALADLYGYRVGDALELPLPRAPQRFAVAGIWRDYARASGALVMPRPLYIELTGDRAANEASVWLAGSASAPAVEAGLRRCLASAGSVELLSSTSVRERSLRIFDHAFVITYALEAIAVLIGLSGVSVAAGANALARRSEFGMLRHLGLRRVQLIEMLAGEGVLMSLLGVLYGVTVGFVLSLVLVYVVNRQSFNWSIDLAVPWAQLALLSVTLVAAAAVTAVWSGRVALHEDAIRAVREDW